MKPEWTGNLVGKMHNMSVTASDLAAQLGVTKSYVSMVFSGARTPPYAQERFEKAYEEILAARKNENPPPERGSKQIGS